MNALTIHGGNADDTTMSSREIAELTGKRHPDVRRDIRNMLEALKRDVSSFAHTYKDGAGREQEEYRLGRELTLTLVSGYDIPLRHRVVTRLAELESRPAIDPMQVLGDPAAMRSLLLGYTEKVLALESRVGELAPKAEALDQISAGSETLTFTQTAKVPGQKREAMKKAGALPIERRGAPGPSAPGVDVQGQVSVGDIKAAIARFRVTQEFRKITFHPVETVADLPAALRAEVQRQYGEGGQTKGLMKERDGVAHVYLIASAREKWEQTFCTNSWGTSAFAGRSPEVVSQGASEGELAPSAHAGLVGPGWPRCLPEMTRRTSHRPPRQISRSR
ncbi:MAG: Rha family transcriptional regulator [Pseudomonadota bacterium]